MGSPRPGDIRRSWADISKAKNVLGYEPQLSLEDGLRERLELARRHEFSNKEHEALDGLWEHTAEEDHITIA